jgi:L-fucose isomerase-like protein
MAKITLGVIVGNRDVFPAELAKAGREQILGILAKEGIDVVTVSPQDTPDGVLMTWKDAEKCAQLFHANSGKIDGILVTLPNFGDERAIADSIKRSGLTVPVYVHAWPDKVDEMGIKQRRDAFCGKLSACNNLRQYGIRYTVGNEHVVSPDSPKFLEELRWFVDICRVVKGLKGARIGSIGERTTPFKTVRYSEKLLESSGISVESKSMVEMVGQVEALKDSDPRVEAKLSKLTNYLHGSSNIPGKAMRTSAKLGVVLDEWVQEYHIDTYAIQCWSAMQGALKIFPCSIMSMMSNELLPSACEVDVMGAVAMYALQIAGGGPSALFDWNNNYGDDPDKLVVFHCSNTATSFMKEVKPGFNAMAVKSNPLDSCYCTLHGYLKPGPIGWARFSTDDDHGRVVGCIGDGVVTGDPLDTFGTTGVVKMPNTQKLLRFLAENGFEHHVAMNYSPRTAVLSEALTKYMGWKIYHHNGEDRAQLANW